MCPWVKNFIGANTGRIFFLGNYVKLFRPAVGQCQESFAHSPPMGIPMGRELHLCNHIMHCHDFSNMGPLMGCPWAEGCCFTERLVFHWHHTYFTLVEHIQPVYVCFLAPVLTCRGAYPMPSCLLSIRPSPVLVATKQLWMVLSVRLSHLFHNVPLTVSSWNFHELLPSTKVMSMQKVKSQGHKGQNKFCPSLGVSRP